MKKTIILLTMTAVAGIGAYVVFAKEPMDGGMMGRGMHGGGMMDSNDMGMHKGMMQRQGMMNMDMMGMRSMSSMMSGGSLVTTPDGGVIVLIGNELYKYDKELKLTKQAEIKIDWAKWRNTMMKHRSMMMGDKSASQ